jgi:hypothetical protein
MERSDFSLTFHAGMVAPLIVDPLRYFFANYTKEGSNLYWDPDEKLRTVDIGEAFDFNKTALQEKPRIIVARGPYAVNKIGLTDNLAEAKAFATTGGRKDFRHLLLYNGSASMLIEARNKGTCELLATMVGRFMVWSRKLLCDSQMFKDIGLPMTMSECMMQPDEDPAITKFQIQMSFPWIREELFRIQDDGVTLKKILMTPTYSSPPL